MSMEKKKLLCACHPSPISKITRTKKAGGMSQTGEHTESRHQHAKGDIRETHTMSAVCLLFLLWSPLDSCYPGVHDSQQVIQVYTYKSPCLLHVRAEFQQISLGIINYRLLHIWDPVTIQIMSHILTGYKTLSEYKGECTIITRSS
jgi:hypothetical protein